MTLYKHITKPKHYNSHPSGVECIEVTRHLNFNLGNAFKYLFRRKHKGEEIENLKKALWYLQDELAHFEDTPFVDLYELRRNISNITSYEPRPFNQIMNLMLENTETELCYARDLLMAEIESLNK